MFGPRIIVVPGTDAGRTRILDAVTRAVSADATVEVSVARSPLPETGSAGGPVLLLIEDPAPGDAAAARRRRPGVAVAIVTEAMPVGTPDDPVPLLGSPEEIAAFVRGWILGLHRANDDAGPGELLARGLAHEVNNALTVILATVDLEGHQRIAGRLQDAALHRIEKAGIRLRDAATLAAEIAGRQTAPIRFGLRAFSATLAALMRAAFHDFLDVVEDAGSGDAVVLGRGAAMGRIVLEALALLRGPGAPLHARIEAPWRHDGQRAGMALRIGDRRGACFALWNGSARLAALAEALRHEGGAVVIRRGADETAVLELAVPLAAAGEAATVAEGGAAGL